MNCHVSVQIKRAGHSNLLKNLDVRLTDSGRPMITLTQCSCKRKSRFKTSRCLSHFQSWPATARYSARGCKKKSRKLLSASSCYRVAAAKLSEAVETRTTWYSATLHKIWWQRQPNSWSTTIAKACLSSASRTTTLASWWCPRPRIRIKIIPLIAAWQDQKWDPTITTNKPVKRRKRSNKWLLMGPSPKQISHQCNRRGTQWHAKTQTCSKINSPPVKLVALPRGLTSFSNTSRWGMKQSSPRNSTSMSKRAIWHSSPAPILWKRALATNRRKKQRRMAGVEEEEAPARHCALWSRRRSLSRWSRKRQTVSPSRRTQNWMMIVSSEMISSRYSTQVDLRLSIDVRPRYARRKPSP